MSVVRYNGITLPYATITQFRQEALYDEVGGTDWYLTKFDVRVTCTVNANYVGMLAPELADSGANAALIMAAVRTSLLKPRKSLSVTFNDYQLMPDVQGDNMGVVDAMNGPQPQSCSIIQLNNVTFLLDYHIIAHYWENNNVNPDTDPPVQNFNGNNVLYNRWTETQELDSCQFSRYTRDGKFMIRSDNRQGLVADQLRLQMAVVGLRNGLLRKSSKYTVSPDGLAIQYRVVDEEAFRKPPSPAFEADGDYTETITNNQAFRFGECRVILRADKTTNQSQLAAAAVNICTRKLLNRSDQLQRKIGMLQSGTLRMSLFKNEAECSIRAMYAANPSRTGGGQAGQPTEPPERVASFVGVNSVVPGIDQDYVPSYVYRGTTGVLLQAAAYYDPSLVNTTIDPAINQFPGGTQPGQGGRFPGG